MDCQICCEKFTKRDRKEVKCPSPDCEGSYCLACFKRFIMESEDIMPKCMCCNKELSYSFVRDYVPITWANKEYVNRRAEHLLAREKSLLPDSQHDVKRELDRRVCTEKEAKIYSEISILRKKMNDLLTVRENMWIEHVQKFDITKNARKTTVTRRRCPEEDCEGFLESNWKCGICDIKCCSDCGISKEEDHVCNEDTKATFQMIKNDTRPCPQCGIPIHKWHGCNQMYCTQCSCMFDYRTGRLETGFFHNPHYFEAIDNGSIQAGHRGTQRLACGMPEPWTFTRRTKILKNITSNHDIKFSLSRIIALYRFIGHITDITLRYKWREGEFDETCRIMRRDYLLKELEESVWKKSLQEIERKREKNTEVRQLVILFRDVSRDCICNVGELFDKLWEKMNFQTDRNLPDVLIGETLVNPMSFILKQLEQVDKIKGFFNEKMLDMKKKFKLAMPHIDSSYRQEQCKQF